MLRPLAFVLLQAALLTASTQAQAQAQAQEQIILTECTPDLVEEFDFTYDGQIGKVEFIQLLEEIAPPTCNVVSLWQNKDTFQSALQELSCLCTEFGGANDANCCNENGPAAFSVQGTYDEAYDHAVCEHIEQIIRVECFEEEEETQLQSSPAAQVVTKPPATSLRHSPSSSLHLAADTTTTTTTTPTIDETSTIDLASGLVSTVGILILCVLVVLQLLSSLSTIDSDVAHKKHQELLIRETQLHDASMEITSTTPYVQIV